MRQRVGSLFSIFDATITTTAIAEAFFEVARASVTLVRAYRPRTKERVRRARSPRKCWQVSRSQSRERDN